MSEEKLLQSAANARLIHLNEQLLFPLLQGKIDERIASLCEALKAQGEVKLSDVAYIAACRDLLQELNSKARHGEHAAKKLNLNPDI